MKYQLSIIFCAIFSWTSLQLSAQSTAPNPVDSLLEIMTLEEKVGQLFMIAAYSNKGEEHRAYVEKMIKDYGVGGVIVMQGGPERQKHLVARLQKSSKFPLLVGQDAEWGQAMRLDSTYKFPTALTVGAVNDLALVKELGTALAYESHKVGVHMSFSPVLDVNTNPKNPIIGARSFGSNPQEVMRRALALIDGMEGAGVLGSGKHFPGHGDTQSDSHKTLPIVDRTLEELKAVEWVPFEGALKQGVASIMVAHLNIPSLEPTGKPTSLSKKVITDILRKDWGYDGLILTDALNMKGVSDFAPVGALEVEAFKAGNDILLFAMDVPKAAQRLVAAFKSGELSMDQLNQSVRRILTAKAQSQAFEHWALAQQGKLTQTLSEQYPDASAEHDALTFKLVAQAATLLDTGRAPFPIRDVQGRFAHIAMGSGPKTEVLEEYLDRYARFDHFTNVVPKGLLRHEAVVVSFHQDPKNPWKRYKLNTAEKAMLEGIKAAGKPIYVLHFANPYGVMTYPDLGENSRVLVMYENNDAAQKLAPQFLFGARATVGALPVDLKGWAKQGSGVKSAKIQRLGYGLPSEVGVSEQVLTKVDSIMDFAIAKEATPGGQILVARKGTVIYDKSFGYHTYDKVRPVAWDHLYDLASVTKITGTLPGMMQWYEKQPLLLKSTIGQQLPELAQSDKGALVLEDVLAHQSGLPAWIPFYLRTIKTDSSRAYWYVDAATPSAVKVSEELYLRPSIKDTMFAMLEQTALKSKDYRYSDLGYYLFQRMLEKRNNESLDRWVDATFYAPLGATHLTYNPLNAGFGLDEIVPTEMDAYWRNTMVHGYVHDMGAAMLGGVAGHAGLFSNANSLAKMMQMYLWGGEYGGVRFLEASTIEKFTSCAFCELKNRRGLGFDRPQDEGPGPSCTCASTKSFGHTGFTGTMVWMDPEEELLYVFLSNRTFPDMENWALSKYDVRTNIQEVLYDALN